MTVGEEEWRQFRTAARFVISTPRILQLLILSRFSIDADSRHSVVHNTDRRGALWMVF